MHRQFIDGPVRMLYVVAGIRNSSFQAMCGAPWFLFAQISLSVVCARCFGQRKRERERERYSETQKTSEGQGRRGNADNDDILFINGRAFDVIENKVCLMDAKES